MKKSKLENILHSRGYVSIETLLIAGLIIASGSFMVSKFAISGKGVSDKSNDSLTNSSKVLDDNDFSKGDSFSEDTGTIKPNPVPRTDFEYTMIDDNFIQNEIQGQSVSGEPHMPDMEIGGNDTACINAMKSILEKEKGNIAITNYNGINQNVIVPSEINGKKVTVISQGAMSKGCVNINRVQTTIKSTEEFTNKIKKESLSENELNDCMHYYIKNSSKLRMNDKDGSISNWMNSISDKYREYSFSVYTGKDNISLTNVTLPDSIKVIGSGAFSGNELTNTNIKNVEYIGNRAFSENKLTNLILPNSIKYIGESAFWNNNLTNVEFPNTISCVGFNAFLDNKLTEVIVPKDCLLYKPFDNNVTVNKR